jgi:hypothetical protein
VEAPYIPAITESDDTSLIDPLFTSESARESTITSHIPEDQFDQFRYEGFTYKHSDLLYDSETEDP